MTLSKYLPLVFQQGGKTNYAITTIMEAANSADFTHQFQDCLPTPEALTELVRMVLADAEPEGTADWYPV